MQQVEVVKQEVVGESVCEGVGWGEGGSGIGISGYGSSSRGGGGDDGGRRGWRSCDGGEVDARR